MQGCTDASTCPGADTECQTRTCDNGQCGFTFTPKDTALASQTPGDCKTAVCDGQGGITTINNDTDALDDGNACTLDTCDNGTPKNPPAALGTECSSGAAKLCDGAGTCVECLQAVDCESEVCQGNKCLAATCQDKVKNGVETDTDCGGKDCGPCEDLKTCVEGADCKSTICASNVCQAPTCEDGAKNGEETDTDCGGKDCDACDDGRACSAVTDCVSGVCDSGVCVAATCQDKVKNGAETDTDCGGKDCGPCDPDKACVVAADCKSQVCAANVCIAPACGDSVNLPPEQCDDGNKSDKDGCSSACAVESGYSCSGSPSVCITSCGDGIKAGSEACDDGNAMSGDGCSSACAVELGYSCSGSPSVCITSCGDGIKAGDEACDDSNTEDGDCCSSTCRVESACEIEPNDAVNKANDFGALSRGGVIKGNINPSTDIDIFSFNISPGTTAAITAETLDGATSSCASGTQDSRVTILAPDGTTELGTDDDSGPGTCALLVVGGLSGGASGADYYVAVTSAVPGLTFDYALKLSLTITVCGNGVKEIGEQCDDGNTAGGDGCTAECRFEGISEIEPNDTPADADQNGAFPLNSLWTGAIDVVGDADIYRLDVAQTIDLSVETFDGLGPNSCDTIDTVISLIAADGSTELANDDDSGVDACSFITPTVNLGARHLYPGTYYVSIHSFSDSETIPAYSIVVTTTALCGNGVKEGFEQCDGGSSCDVNCDVIPTCGDGLLSAGEQCDDGNATSGDGCSSACLVEGVGQEIEPNNTFAQADAQPVLKNNDRIGGSINPAGDKDIYRIDVTNTSIIRFETFETVGSDCPTIATALTLFDASGTLLKVDSPPDADPPASGINDCAALVTRLDPGSYYIQVEAASAGDTISFYLLEVAFQTDLGREAEPNDTQAQANPVSGSDVFVFGDHQNTLDEDFYSITIPAGKSLRVELIEGDATLACEGTDIDSLLTLFDASGNELVSDDDDGRGRCSEIDGTGASPRDPEANNLPAGTYFLQARAFGTTGSQFNYNLVFTVR